MRHDKLRRELLLLELLVENRSLGVRDLCERVGISRRNLYYYLDFFRECGFDVYTHEGCHCIDRNSRFFSSLLDRVSISDDEALLLRQLLEREGGGNDTAARIKDKLERFYDMDVLADAGLRKRVSRNADRLYEAIKGHRQVLVHGYVSVNSHTTSDRMLEPFMMVGGSREVRCFEPSSMLNKTFKLSRMRRVEVLDAPWRFRNFHKVVHTDVFMFSGEERLPVRVALGDLAYNILAEEFPRALGNVVVGGEGTRILDLDVCSYKGVGRFVLGLYDDVEVLGGDGFRAYVDEAIGRMARKAGAPVGEK